MMSPFWDKSQILCAAMVVAMRNRRNVIGHFVSRRRGRNVFCDVIGCRGRSRKRHMTVFQCLPNVARLSLGEWMNGPANKSRPVGAFNFFFFFLFFSWCGNKGKADHLLYPNKLPYISLLLEKGKQIKRGGWCWLIAAAAHHIGTSFSFHHERDLYAEKRKRKKMWGEKKKKKKNGTTISNTKA